MKQLTLILIVVLSISTTVLSQDIKKDYIYEIELNGSPDNILVLNVFLGLVNFQLESTGCSFTMTLKKFRRTFSKEITHAYIIRNLKTETKKLY